ncbi:MAG: type II toxin-antitoxin system RelE/ParE family toxin, partial [Acetobacter sp.]|nr:type II toxin-antitoxin system RelE/ParE family toxin [Acetobacter sp.]
KKQIDDNLFELRGHGRQVFRIYYMHKSENTIIALTGGDKSTQKEDILLIRELIEAADED